MVEDDGGGKRRKEAVRGVHALLDSLEGVMAAPAYLSALLALARHPADKPRRRALKLFAEKVAAVPDRNDEEDGKAHSSDVEAAAAATQLCGALPVLLGAPGEINAPLHCA